MEKLPEVMKTVANKFGMPIEEFVDKKYHEQYGIGQTQPAQKGNDAGAKYDAGKPSIGLIDRTALVELARVLDFGAKKYAAHNWRGGIKWQRIIDSAMRHLHAFNDGEDLDPETGISHIAHAMCNCMFLLNYIQTHKELDDRYKTSVPVHPMANAVGSRPYAGTDPGIQPLMRGFGI